MRKELNLNDLSEKARGVYEVSDMSFEQLPDGNYIKTDADHRGEILSLEQINEMLELEAERFMSLDDLGYRNITSVFYTKNDADEYLKEDNRFIGIKEGKLYYSDSTTGELTEIELYERDNDEYVLVDVEELV